MLKGGISFWKQAQVQYLLVSETNDEQGYVHLQGFIST